MAAEVEDLREMVGTTTADDSVLDRCLDLAHSLVETYTSKVPKNTIPPAVYEEAVLIVAVDQFNRRKAPNGIVNQQFAGSDGSIGTTAIRINRDPLVGAKPLLAQWVKTVKRAGSVDMAAPYADPCDPW